MKHILPSKNLPLLATAENTALCNPKKNTTGLKTLLVLVLMVMGMGVSWGQSYLGLDGGFEGTATIDNSEAATAAATGKWTKNNAVTTIAEEISVVRSGGYSLKITNSSTTGKRVWSPLFTQSSTTSSTTIQFYRRSANNSTNFQQSMLGVGNGTTTDQSSGTYAGVTAINTWEKVTYTRASWTYTDIAGVITTRLSGTGTLYVYADDIAVYAGALDTTAPNAANSAIVSAASSTSMSVGWTAASGGVDGGGYVVVRGTSDPTTTPNVNGIYAVGNTIATGMTVVYNGTGTSFTDTGLTAGTTYYYRIYTYDKAYNYAAALTGNAATTASASLTPPALTAAGSATVDAAFDVTFTDANSWASNITGITIGGTALTAGYVVGTNKITFTPSASVPTGLLQTAGVSKSIVVSATGFSTSTVAQTIGVGAATKLAISVQPTAPTTNGGALAQQPTVLIQDQYGNTTASTATVTATAVQGTWTAGGSNTKAGVAGSAAFSGLTATSAAAVTGATIAFSSGSLTSITSSAFNIPAPPPANDLCASKIALTVNAAAIAGTSVLATQTVLSAEFETLTSDVWYSFTATATANATVTVLNGTSLDYDLFVYTPSCPTDGTTYISKASTATTTSESVTFAATLGVTYIIRVGQFGSGAGTSFTIGVTMPTSSTWNGTAWSNGAPTSSLDAIIAGNYSTTTNGVFSAKTLTVNSGKSFTINTGHNITVAGAVTNNNGTLTIANNANLIQTNDVANTGNAIVKRNSANIQLYDYTLWSSPVTNISQYLTTFSPNTLATRFYTYNPTTNLYNAVSSPSTTNFDVGTGYLIRAPNNWVAGATAAPFEGQFTGVPNNGTKNLNSLASGSYYAVGNPYPSTILADSFINGNSTDGTLYFWRKTNNAATTSYATYTLAGGTATAAANLAGNSSIIPSGIIQVGQGFIVKTGASATTLTFNNTMRTANNANQFLKSSEEKSRIWLNLSSATGFVCQTMVAYMPEATTGVDNGIDGLYFNDSPTALTSIIDATEFAIQGKPVPFDTNDTVPLGFKTNAAGNFSIGIDHVDGLFSNGQTIYLKDNLVNTTVNLSASSYTFASEVGIFNSRFEIVYQSALALPTFTANNVIVYSHNGEVTINSGKTPMNQVRIFDVRGRLLAEKNHINATETKLTVGAQNQVLLVKIGTTEGGEVTKKIIQ